MSSTSGPPHNTPRSSPPARSPAMSPSPAERERCALQNAGPYHLSDSDRLAIYGDHASQLNLQPPQPSRRTSATFLTQTARQSRFAIRETHAMRTAVERLDEFFRTNHAKFLNAIHPASTKRAEAASALRDFLFTQNPAEVAQTSKQALADFMRITADEAGDEPYSRTKRDEVAFIKEHLTWHRGQSVASLLAPSRFTDSQHPKVVDAAHVILTAPEGPSRASANEPRALLQDILMQRYKNTVPGKPVQIHGLDGKMYIWSQLLAHPRWGDLLIGDNLWQLLRDPTTKALLESNDGTFTNLTPQEETRLERLAMAQRIASVVIHYAVRDSVKYGLGNWKQRASEVLRQPHASCSGSANLATALARAVNIPAGSVYSWVRLPDYFYVVMAPTALSSKGRTSVHVDTCYVTLEREDSGFVLRNVRADATDHVQLAEALMGVNYPATNVVDFDGTRDALLKFPPQFVYDWAGPITNIDPLLSKSSTVAPAPEERWQFIRYVASRLNADRDLDIDRDIPKLAEDFADLAERMVVEPWHTSQATYATYVEAYNAALDDALRGNAGNALHGHLGHLAKQFFTTTDGIACVCQHAEEPVMTRQAFTHFAAARGVPDTVLSPRLDAALSEVASHLHISFLGVPPQLRDAFAEAFDATGRYSKALQLGEDPATRKAVWSRIHARNYLFMIRCYPTSEDKAWGAAGFKQWLPRDQQDAYFAWLPRAKGLDHVFTEPNTAALLHLLGERRSTYFDHKTGTLNQRASEIIARENIDLHQLQQYSDFHAHLLSNVSMTVMNRFIDFGEKEGPTIRRADYGTTEFEAYLRRTNEALYRLHKEEGEDNPFFPYSVYSYLLKLLPMSLLGPAHEALADFVTHIESGTVGKVTSEAQLDEAFRNFLADATATSDKDRVPIEAFESRVPGGPLKPYGVLWALVKAYILLPPEEGMKAIHNLVAATRKNEAAPADDIFWF